MKFLQIRIALLMTMAWFVFSKTLTDSKSASKAKHLDVSPIITEITSKARTVLLLSLLPKRLFVIVSATGKKVLTSDSVVFEESPASLKAASVELSWAQLFADKWPQVSLTPGTIGVLSDSCADYLVIGNADKLQMLNLATGDIAYKTLGKTFDNYYFGSYFTGRTVFSSSQPMAIWTMDSGHHVYSGDFRGVDLFNSTGIKEGISGITICQNHPSGISLQGSFHTEAVPCGTMWQIPWAITAGLLTPHDAYLVDATSRAVLKFSTENAPFHAEQTTSFTSIPFATFWREAKGKPVAPGTDSGRCASKEKKQKKNQDIEVNSTIAHMITTPGRTMCRTWVVILSVLLCITFLYALIITGLYLFSKVPNASMHSGKSSSSKAKSISKVQGKLQSASKIQGRSKVVAKAATSKMASTGSAI